MMNCFVTLLSSDNYLQGVLALNHSLVKVHAKYPLLALLTPNISLEVEKKLQESQINVQRILPKFTPPLEIVARIPQKRWANTFEKLQAFELVRFTKIILMDSDMLVFQNIDHLFELPHLSAAKGSGDLNGFEHWQLFNSGLLIIAPDTNLGEKVFATWETVVKQTDDFGDQDLIKAYYGDYWLRNNLRLPTTYNCFAPFLDRFVREKNYNLNFTNPNEQTVHVIHYVYSLKPWQMSYLKLAFFFLKRLIKGQKYYAWAIFKHLKIQQGLGFKIPII